MIAHIQGKLVEKTPTEVVIDCNGVGYHVNISLHTFSLLPNADFIKLFTHLQTRFAGISKGINNAQNVGLFPLEKHGNGEFMFIPTDFNPSLLTERDYENPYMGLQAYTDERAHLFFGREKAKQELLEKIEKQSFIVIIGASGTGKSSLVKAGILPKLKEKDKEIAEMRPNKDPMAELSNLGNDFNVLVIDQFEEIVTQSDPTKAAEFTEILRGYIDNGSLKIKS